MYLFLFVNDWFYILLKPKQRKYYYKQLKALDTLRSIKKDTSNKYQDLNKLFSASNVNKPADSTTNLRWYFFVLVILRPKIFVLQFFASQIFLYDPFSLFHVSQIFVYRGARGSHAPLSIPPNFSKHVADSLNVFSLALNLNIFLKVSTDVSVYDLNKV